MNNTNFLCPFPLVEEAVGVAKCVDVAEVEDVEAHTKPCIFLNFFHFEKNPIPLEEEKKFQFSVIDFSKTLTVFSPERNCYSVFCLHPELNLYPLCINNNVPYP